MYGLTFRNSCHKLYPGLFVPTCSYSKALATHSVSHHAAAPYVNHKVTDVQHVPVPLCRRPASHVELVSALLHWRQAVLDEIATIKNGFAAADGGGADAAELQVRYYMGCCFCFLLAGTTPEHPVFLQREVTWVLDDVVAAWREQEQQQWMPCSWQQLHLELQTATRRNSSTGSWQVQLRAPVQQLQPLWQLRLQERVPFQYLIHTAHWRDLVLAVGPGVLVPRPETEVMPDLAAAAVAGNPALARRSWADLGTGSGAIAIATARMLLLQQQQQQYSSSRNSSSNSSGVDTSSSSSSSSSSNNNSSSNSSVDTGGGGAAAAAATMYAVDLSPTAVAYASANATACGVQDHVRVCCGSWFEPLQQLKGQLGGVLSNPPYIPRAEMTSLQVEVGQHEPWSALDGGPEQGIDSLEVIISGASVMLAPGGFLALETAGRDQAYLVQQLLQQLPLVNTDSDGAGGTTTTTTGAAQPAAFTDVVVHDDCFGVPRFVTARRTMN